MSNIRHILRLHTQKHTRTQIILQTGIHRDTLKNIINAFEESKFTFEEINELNDKDLKELFLIPKENPLDDRHQILYKLFPYIDKELKRTGVTKQLIWKEYKLKHPDGFSRSHFNVYFSQWKSRTTPYMPKEHKAGDKLYIDFAGEKLSITDKQTSEVKPVEVFVSVLGASQLTYVQATMTQQKEDFIAACEDALHFYGGVPAAIVPDNLKSAVSKSSKYEPSINETFDDFAEHYNTTILPARAYKPKDKALVEIAINIIYTRIYAKLRDIVFFSLEELNHAISLALEEHNNQLLTGKNQTRRQLFEEVEKAALLPLPQLRYEFKNQQLVKVMKNGYAALNADKHFYSVPFDFIGKRVKVMYTRSKVDIFYNYNSIASHQRSKEAFKYTTDKNHISAAHRFINEWTPEHFIKQAEEIHADVKLYITQILNQKQHPEKGFKMCVGVLGFSKKVGKERLIMACQRALGYGIYSYKTIQKILQRGLDKHCDDEMEEVKMPEHENIRGKEYYH